MSDYTDAARIERECRERGTPEALRVALLALALQEHILANAAERLGMARPASEMRAEAERSLRKARRP